MEPARLRLKKLYNTEQIYNLARQQGVIIALAYDNWFVKAGFGGLPPQWVEVGKWSISNNVITGGNTVILYAVDPSAYGELAKNFMLFAKELPVNVKRSINLSEVNVSSQPDENQQTDSNRP
jgi:hypothetical protein